MALTLLFLAGHIVDYLAKVMLLVDLWRQDYREHFAVLLWAWPLL